MAMDAIAAERPEHLARDLPYSLLLELTVHDPDTIAELCRHSDGEERDQFAIKALRIGVLALRQARGQIDADLVRRESERLLDGMHGRLTEHSGLVQERLAATLKEYFDPQNGRFQERVERLVKQDGELEQTLRRQIGGEDSELRRTLTAHFGDDSPLMKILNPDQSQGLLAALRMTLDDQLSQQREHVLRQFSLDNKDGALSRFIAELVGHQGKFSDEMRDRVDKAVQQFSLDDENSALSRLVRNVRDAQRTISAEFSLDSESSALSRLKRILDDTHGSIHAHLSLDDDGSALARLKRELQGILEKHGETNQRFQEEVKSTLQAMNARRDEANRSTRHGLAFEDAVFQQIQHESQRVGDLASPTKNSPGRINRCKIGDCVIELGPETAAPLARIVVEAKEDKKYTLAIARDEIETARKNRDAQIGVFVFSKRSAPDGLEPVTRLGHDVFVLWDSEDSQSDLFLRVGVSLARALCVRHRAATDKAQAADFVAIDEAILEIEKRVGGFDELETWTKTIQNSCERILDRLRLTRKSLDQQVGVLQGKTAAIKTLVASTDAS